MNFAELWLRLPAWLDVTLRSNQREADEVKWTKDLLASGDSVSGSQTGYDDSLLDDSVTDLLPVECPSDQADESPGKGSDVGDGSHARQPEFCRNSW